jgi:hypothetical protein
MKSSTAAKVRRALLKPLLRRKGAPARANRVQLAFRDLEARANASASLRQLAEVAKHSKYDANDVGNLDGVAARISLAHALHVARRLSFQEYLFILHAASEALFFGRMNSGTYPELRRLAKKMQSVEEAHGLTKDEYWRKSDAPPEYRALAKRWDRAARAREAEVLHELDASKIAHALFNNDPRDFDRLRERGRRAYFHKDETVAALNDAILRYEVEAKAAARAKAYTAAVVLLGAAVEGMLIVRCLNSRRKAAQVAAALPRGKRPKEESAPSTWRFETLIEVCLRAGWLPAVDLRSVTVLPVGLAHTIRQMRNFVHPGKAATERPWIEVDAFDFADAEGIFAALFATIHGRKATTRMATRP